MNPVSNSRAGKKLATLSGLKDFRNSINLAHKDDDMIGRNRILLLFLRMTVGGR